MLLCPRLFISEFDGILNTSHFLVHQGLVTLLLVFSKEDTNLLLSKFLQKEGRGNGNSIFEHGLAQKGYFLLHLCCYSALKEGLPWVIIFPLPFRPALRNFKDSIMKKAFKNHGNHTAFESANACGVLLRLKQQASDCALSLICGLALWEIQRQLYNFKFRLPQRKRCIWHPNAVALTILMEVCGNWGNLPPRRKWWKTARETFYLWDKKTVF